jgi:hypothetical protein
MGVRVYAGRSARTRQETLVYSCPCGERFRAQVYRALDSSDAQAVARLLDGRLNRVACPSCDAAADLQVPVVFHDLAAPRLVLVLPDGLRHRELEERAAFFNGLAADAEPPPDYVLDAPTVFGAAGLRAVLAPPPSEESFARALPTPSPTEPIDLNERAEATQPRIDPSEIKRRHDQKKQQPEPKKAEHPSLADATTGEHSKVSPAEMEEINETRVRMNVPDPRSAMIERWIAGREGPAAFLVEEQVLVCASMPQPTLEQFLTSDASRYELRVQLHRMPSYPVLAVTVIAPSRGDERVLTVALDVARAAHRVVLDALARKCACTVELYDSQYLPVVSHRVSAPLEDNVKRLLTEARDAVERLAPSLRNFERARSHVFQPGYDRLGRTQVELPDEKLESLERPAAVLAALAQVSRWSEPNAEAYLIEIRSFSLARWRALRARVILRALDVGIAVSRPLVERSAKEHSSPLPSWQELLAIQVRRFSEISSRVRANDLSPAEEAENWDLLLRECALAGVVVEDQIRQLAAQAVKRARASSGAGVDLRSLDTAELVSLLDPGPNADPARRELRRQAALILCERREAQTLPLLFAALRRMTRGEANVILPAVTQYGAASEKLLIEGLHSKKAFMRQGCALALGRLRSPLGVDALAKQLLVEPTEIWTEVARALGDVGAQAVMPVAAQLRSSGLGGEQRERVVLALAHVAARGTRQPIEMLAAGRDALVAAVARRALDVAGEVRSADDVVRNGRGAWAEQTVVRGFSRRFYEALEAGSGAIELDPSDLEELGQEAQRESAHESADSDEDYDIHTATNIAPLRPKMSPNKSNTPEDTSPVPKIDANGPKSPLPGAGS